MATDIVAGPRRVSTSWCSPASDARRRRPVSTRLLVSSVASPIRRRAVATNRRVASLLRDGDPLYERYHDGEASRADERGLFERLSRAFQSGLSWRTILAKREAFRAAFAGFDPDAVARFESADVERLLGDEKIVRNRAKIEATIANARATVALRDAGDSLDAVIRAHAPTQAAPPAAWTDVPATTPETVALARELKRRGFKFVGPTTLYALMQACGLVDDHLANARHDPLRARPSRRGALAVGD